MAGSASGLGRRVLSSVTGVRIPYSLRHRICGPISCRLLCHVDRAVVAHQVELLASNQRDGVRVPAAALDGIRLIR